MMALVGVFKKALSGHELSSAAGGGIPARLGGGFNPETGKNITPAKKYHETMAGGGQRQNDPPGGSTIMHPASEEEEASTQREGGDMDAFYERRRRLLANAIEGGRNQAGALGRHPDAPITAEIPGSPNSLGSSGPRPQVGVRGKQFHQQGQMGANIVERDPFQHADEPEGNSGRRG
jgi:hypothetical protein